MQGQGNIEIRKLSILVPVYNEARTIGALLQRVEEAPLPCEREIIVVDDGSTDGTREALEAFAGAHPAVKVLVHEHNRGKGQAIRSAIAEMSGDWAIIQDADLEYAPEDYQAMLLPVQRGLADVVFGSRFVMGRYRRAMYFWHTLANKALTLLTNVLADLNITDMETCYKLVRADLLKALRLRSKGFDIEPELTVKLARSGARIYEVPISYSGRTYAEGKKIYTRDACIAFWALFKYRFLDRRYLKHDGLLTLLSVQRAKRFNRWMYSQVEPWLGQEVLEAGCGIGNLTQFVLGKKRLVCIDTDPLYVDRMRNSYDHLANFRVLQADLRSAEDMARTASDGPFDSAFCLNVLEHVEDDAAALKNLHSVLKPGGRTVILVPHSPSLYTGVDKALGHVRRYTPETLQNVLERAGFTVLKCWGFNRVGGLGWRVSGKILRRTTLTTGQMTLFDLALPLIRLLEYVPFHAHLSLIAVGERPDGSG